MAAREQITIELKHDQLLAARHGGAITHWTPMSPQPPQVDGLPVWRQPERQHHFDWLSGWSEPDDDRAATPTPETNLHERLVAQDGTELHQVAIRPERRDNVWGWVRVLEPVRA